MFLTRLHRVYVYNHTTSNTLFFLASQHSNGGRTPPQNVPPQNISPQNVPPQNVPPQNVPPQDVPYQNVPYQNVPDLNQSPLPVSVYIYVHSEAI